MKLRIFAGENPRQTEYDIPKDTKVIILNSDTEIFIAFETEHGVVDNNDEPVIVLAGANKNSH